MSIYTFSESRSGGGYDIVNLDHSRTFFKSIPTRHKAERLVGKLNNSVREGQRSRMIAKYNEKRHVNIVGGKVHGNSKNIPIHELIEVKEKRKHSKTRFEGSKYIKDIAEKYDVDIATIYNKLRGL